MFGVVEWVRNHGQNQGRHPIIREFETGRRYGFSFEEARKRNPGVASLASGQKVSFEVKRAERDGKTFTDAVNVTLVPFPPLSDHLEAEAEIKAGENGWKASIIEKWIPSRAMFENGRRCQKGFFGFIEGAGYFHGSAVLVSDFRTRVGFNPGDEVKYQKDTDGVFEVFPVKSAETVAPRERRPESRDRNRDNRSGYRGGNSGGGQAPRFEAHESLEGERRPR